MVQKQSPKPGLEEIIAEAEAETPRRDVDRRSVKDLWMNAWEGFRELSWFRKIIYIVEYPFTLLRDMSTPLVEEDRWNKYWLLFSSFGAPFLFAYFSNSIFYFFIHSLTISLSHYLTISLQL